MSEINNSTDTNNTVDTAEVETSDLDSDTAAKVAEKRLIRQAANLRQQRNRALRREHAYEVILEAHGIDYSAVNDTELESLNINQGAVDGKFAYKAPAIGVPKPTSKKTETPAPPSLQEVRKWPADKINSNWKMIKNLMRGSK